MNRAPVSRSDSVGRSDGAAFRRWLVALCTIRFDLEQGQVVEECFPASALSTEEELDVAFSSFPDSMSQAENRASIHDCVFFFRIRRRGSAVATISPSTLRRSASLANERAAEVTTPVGSPPSQVLRDLAEAGQKSVEGSPLREAAEADSKSTEGSPLREVGDTGYKSVQGSPILKGGIGLDGSPVSKDVNRSTGPLITKGGSPSITSRQGSVHQETAERATVDDGSTASAGRSEDSSIAKGQSSEGSWGLSVIDKLASVISPKLKSRDSGNANTGDSPTPTVVNGSPPKGSLCISRDKENSILGHAGYGSSRGGPGSGAQRYLYGFVFNRQRQDERLKRGGEQKSVVVLSERPFSCVYKPLVQILGPLYFDIGQKALEQVAADVAQWPAPLHGQLMELSVAGSTIKGHLPPAHTLPPGSGNPIDEFTCAIAPAAPVARSVPQGIFHEADLFGMFRGVLMQLWVLWELLLVGEPLLVIAPTPSQCCEAVAALVGLVAPLPCSMDFRPYFTIHDPDFATLNALKEGEHVPPMVLGVTNLFFLKALRSLPHVISVGNTLSTANRFKVVSRSASQNGSNGAKPSPGRLQIQVQLSPLKRFSPTNLLKVARVKKDGPISLMSEHKEALWTNFSASTKPDTAVLNRLVDAGATPRTEESMTLVNNEILRRHFIELTTNFLSPFGPYLRASAPQEGTSPFADPPPLPRFDAHEFLDGLAARGSGKFLAKRLRGNWLELYRRFLKGPNFMPWFQRRRAVAEQEQHRIWRQARSKADVRGFLAKMSEVEIIDSFSAIERHLINELQIVQRAGLGNSEGPICQKLRSDLRAIFNVLPKDMQQMLLFNPQRASLLQGGRELTKLPGRASFSFRSSDPADVAIAQKKGESFRIRNASSPELTARRALSLQRNPDSPSITSKISPLVSPAPSSRAQELAQDPLDLEKH